MNISGKLEWTDYLKAQYLHMRPNGWMLVAWSVLVALMVLTLGSLAVLSLLSGSPASAWLAVWPIIVMAALFLAYLYWYLPWKVRRIYEQQKETHAPFEHEITTEGLLSSNEYGNTKRPWGLFSKWKENKDLFMLYLSDVQFIALPKRCCTAEQLEALHARVAEHRITDASRFSWRSLIPIGAVLLFIVLAGLCMVIAGAWLYLSLRNSAP